VVHKRVERVLDVADRLGEGAVIDVIGRGPVAIPLATEITARGLADRVRLRGFLPEANKRAAVAGSLLHLNTSQGEGWGLCVLEAAALGVPTVAYDVDGLRDAVRDGETGWLVRAGQRIEDVAECAVKELSDPVRRAEMAAACRRWAGQFDWDSSVSLMAGLIVTAQRRRAERLEQPSPHD
jgi:glycosyltransferase involved in cell wall biosynthesis